MRAIQKRVYVKKNYDVKTKREYKNRLFKTILMATSRLSRLLGVRLFDFFRLDFSTNLVENRLVLTTLK